MESPFTGKALVADDLDYAIRMTAVLGDRADEWRAQRFKELNELAQQVLSRREECERARGFASSRVSKHVRLERVDLTRYAVGWPDVALADMVCAGATVTGKLPHAGIYREADVRAALDRDDFHLSNDDWVNEVCSKPPPTPDQAKVIWEKSQDEVAAGLLRGFWDKAEMDKRWGPGQWRCLVRFAVWQAGSSKYRVIDNGRTAGHNATLSTDERIHTATVESGAAMLRRLREVLGKPLVGPYKAVSSTQDMKRAFRQLGVRDQDRRYHVIALWEPGKGWRFGELDGLAFGLGAAVLEFNRVPEHVVAVARRWLALPVTHFYDDYRLIDLLASRGSADKFFDHLCAWLGWELDPGKHQSPASLIKFLGVLEEIKDQEGGEFVTLMLEEDKRKAILEELTGAVQGRDCPPALMAHLVGKLVHYSSTIAGRVGLGMLTPLAHFAAGESRTVTDEVANALTFYVKLLRTPRFKSIQLSGADLESTTIISDASWADSVEPGVMGKVCFILMEHDRRKRWGGVLTLKKDDELTASFVPRKSQIMAAELMGPLLGLAYCGPRIASTAATFYVDNLSALCAIVKGGSKRVDLAGVACGIQFGLHLLDVKGWVDYVESESNLTDGGSRTGANDPMAAGYGVHLKDIKDFSLPEGFPQASPDAWHEWWKAAYARALLFRNSF